MREMNTIHSFIDDSEFHETQNDAMMAVDNGQITSVDYLNINNEKCADSGIVYDPDDVKNSSKFSINSHEECETAEERRKSLLNRRREFNDSGIDSIPKISISSTRDFFSKQSLSIKSSSVSTVAVPLRDITKPSSSSSATSSSKIRSKRYSLPDIDKLKAYNDIKNGKRGIRKITQCDNTEIGTQNAQNQARQLPLVPTEAKLIPLESEKLDNFNIDPKLINKYDGLCQSLYYIDENGSPKIRERYINQQRMIIERQEAKKREKQAKRELNAQNTSTCSCFSFSRFTKKLKELCKYFLFQFSRSFSGNFHSQKKKYRLDCD